MSWKRSVLTDSGGFQIFSLPHSRSMSEEGAVFQSYLDGRTIMLSPELSIETQKAIGSDIMMALDQCIASTADEATARAALDVTHRWAARSLAARGDSPQSMFAIVQGALFPELRRESAAVLSEMPFDGFAIGGLAVGESKSEREDLCEFTAQLLPDDKPRYLMGVGTPLDILEAVHRGVDMFDCIMPTQVAQRGAVFTSRGFLQCAAAFTSSPRSSSIPPARARRAPDTPALTCITSPRRARRSAGSCSGSTTSTSITSSCARSAQSILADCFLDLYREKRAFLHESDMDNPIRAAEGQAQEACPRWEITRCTKPGRDSRASARSRPARSCIHARRRWRRRKRLYIEQSNLAERVRLSPGGDDRTVDCLGRRTRSGGKCDGGNPLL